MKKDEIKLTSDLKFRYVDTELSKEEILNLTKEDWMKLYLYMVQRDKPFKKGIIPTMKELMKWKK